MLLITAGLIDVLVNHLRPFRAFDVLYLLGVSTFLIGFLSRLSRRGIWLVLFCVLGLAPLLRIYLGYTDVALDLNLDGTPLATPQIPSSIPRHWLVDGWFPLFPWFGLFLFGYQLEALVRLRSTRTMLAFGWALLAVGVALWILAPGPAYVRLGYIELFYPPTVGFTLSMMGFIPLVYLGCRSLPAPFDRFLQRFGECTLAIYILHLAIIRYILKPIFGPQDPLGYLAVYFLLIGILTICAEAIRRVKQTSVRRPTYAKFLLGG
jgi:uncharacterized membrane protein